MVRAPRAVDAIEEVGSDELEAWLPVFEAGWEKRGRLGAAQANTSYRTPSHQLWAPTRITKMPMGRCVRAPTLRAPKRPSLRIQSLLQHRADLVAAAKPVNASS